MKFYNRQDEMAELNLLFNQASDQARMTVLTGRRRMGKTLLSLEFAKKHRFIYLFVANKSEKLLCEEYLEEIKKNFDIPIIGEVTTFKYIFSLLLEIAKKERFVLIVDEFQRFFKINPAVYSEIQDLWDRSKSSSMMHVVFIGSVCSLMKKIFEDEGEPLFGRADRNLYIKPFKIADLHHILKDNKIDGAALLFDYYVLTGGTPKYVDLFVTNKLTHFDSMIDFVFRPLSPLLNEGKSLLVEEFGKDYMTYFSVLELIATGKTSRNAITSILQKDIGGYLERLEKNYDIIRRYLPINSKPGAKLQKYKIIDNFVAFWFRFIYRYRTAVEIENFDYIKTLLKRDYSSYSGALLEQFFQLAFSERKQFNRVGAYWERDHQNEIDLVAINDAEHRIVIGDVKLNKSKINISKLKEKSKKLIRDFEGYNIEYIGLSLEDIAAYC